MGIDITGFSKARRFAGRHSDETCDEENHYPVGRYRKLLDGRKPGCYICDGKSVNLYASYSGFDRWRNELAFIFYGVPANGVLDNPRRYKGHPFWELIALPFSNDVGIGPMTSAKLYEDFAKYSTKVKRGFQQLTADAASRSTRERKRTFKTSYPGGKLAQSLAKALGGMAVGS